MLNRIFLALLLMFFVWPIAAEVELGEDGLPKQDMLEYFAPYAGQWHITAETEPTELMPDKVVSTSVQEAGFILDKTMFQFRAVTTIDGKEIESLMLVGYDRIEKAYCSWHYLQDGFVIKSKLDWADDGQSYTATSLDKQRLGATATAEVQLVDEDTIRWRHKVVLNDGRTLSITNVEARRKDVEIVYPEREVKDDDKLAIFEAYTGRWNTVLQGKATDVYDKPYKLSHDWEGRYRLGGKFFEFSGPGSTPDGQDYEYLWLYSYDEREGQYVCWYHSSFVHHARQDVEWNEEERSLTMHDKQMRKLGLKPMFKTYLVDEENLRFTFKMKTIDGVLISDEVGEAKPVKGNQN
jgi:hypothetical protein